MHANGLPHQLLDIAEVHIGGMLRAGQLERAATLCASYLGRRPELWQRWIRAFGAAGALPQLAPHVPLSNPQLPHETYEQTLAAAITPPAAIAAGAGGGTSAGAVAGGPNDPGAGAVAGGPNDPGAHLLLLLRRWPSSVYRPAVVQRAVLDIARRLPGGLLAQPRLMESMALLHCHAKQHEAALRLLLQLPPHEVDVFHFIELHSVHGYCRDKVSQLAAHSRPPLMSHDCVG